MSTFLGEGHSRACRRLCKGKSSGRGPSHTVHERASTSSTACAIVTATVSLSRTRIAEASDRSSTVRPRRRARHHLLKIAIALSTVAIPRTAQSTTSPSKSDIPFSFPRARIISPTAYNICNRVVWRARLDLARRAGRFTSLHADIGLALARKLGQEGRCDSSHATLATGNGARERTVRRALDTMAGVV